MATTYRKTVTHREVDYTIEIEVNIIEDPIMHKVTVLDDSNATVWEFDSMDNNLERSDEAAIEAARQEINKRLDGDDYLLNRITALGYV